MSNTNIESIYPLSPMQQGMLFHTLYAPTSGVYLAQICITLHGELNVQFFQQAWEQLVRRHTALRTAFAWKNLDKPLQVVSRQVSLPWTVLDWLHLRADQQKAQLSELLAEDRARGFELSMAPL